MNVMLEVTSVKAVDSPPIGEPFAVAEVVRGRQVQNEALRRVAPNRKLSVGDGFKTKHCEG
jgi:hypothetical protein